MNNLIWAGINFVIFLFFFGAELSREEIPIAAIPPGLLTIFFLYQALQ